MTAETLPAVGSAGLDRFGAAAFAAVLLAGYLVVGEPLVGRVLHRRFEAALAHDRHARLWLYRRLLVLEWGLLGLVALVVARSPDVGLDTLGVRRPSDLLSWGPLLAVLAVLLFAGGSLWALRAPSTSEEPSALESAPIAVSSLLPRTRVQRRWFTLVSITAGICEEVLYRGFFLVVVAALAPSLGDPLLVLAGGLAFGLAHFYQGVTGVVSTAVLGGAFSYLFLATGSLLLPVVLHALIDLRLLAIPAAVLPAEGRHG